jgi:hypothetical protein
LLIVNSLKNVGAVANLEVQAGDELAFCLRVHGEPWGLGTYDHYSNSIFAKITPGNNPNTYLIGFEDLPADRADWDFNDAILLVEFLPLHPPNGKTTNFLGEQEVVSDQGDGASLIADLDDGKGFKTTLTVPRSALTSPASLILTDGNPELYEKLTDPAVFQSLGVFRKIVLTNGQGSLEDDGAELSISYPDQDQNGIIDNTGFLEDELAIYRYDAGLRQWVALPTNVDNNQNQASTVTSHFSLFALGVVPRTTGNTIKGSVNNNWFGCQLATEGDGGARLANCLLLLAAVTGTVGFIRISNRRASR